MQMAAFEAALELIERGPADQPLMRILDAAMNIADCPIGLIGIRTEDAFRIFVSKGLPLANLQLELQRSEAIAELLRGPVVIEDARAQPAFRDHPYVVGAPGWRFIASVPLPLPLLPYPVLLMCCDPRLDHPRRRSLLASLEECAAIAADALSLISDIASQAMTIAEVRHTSMMRDASVMGASVPMALVDGNGQIMVINEPLRQLVALSDHGGGTVVFASLFPMETTEITNKLRDVLNDRALTPSIQAHLNGSPDCPCTIDIIRVTSTDNAQPSALCTVIDNRQIITGVHRLAPPRGENPAIVSNFLLNTLIKQKRLLRRGEVPFHALRRWRTTVKDTQLEALKALKSDPPTVLVEAVATEIASAARQLFGKETIQAVVAVPCGNSGANCLASRLAPAVAERLGLPAIDAFLPLAPSGGSHPQGNTRRERMRLRTEVDMPVLLIDDVATSGAHVAEAALALKAAGTPAVLPLVWLAAS